MVSLDKIEPLDLSKVFKDTHSANQKQKKTKRDGLAWKLYKWLCVRHLFISSLLLIWTFGGAFGIWRVEKAAEERKLIVDLSNVEAELENITSQLITNIPAFENVSLFEDVLKIVYMRMEKAESIYVGSALHKDEDIENNVMWRFWPSTFFAANIYMTVGYGAIHCFTGFGRFLSIVYGFISIPLSLVVLRDLSQWILVVLTRLYGRIVVRWRKDYGVETDPNEEFAFPIKLTVLIWLGNWLFVAFCTWCYDAWWALRYEPKGAKSQDFFDAFYYSWITLTSMGMSDDMPVYSTTSPWHPLWHFMAMPVYKMGLRIVYISMENGIIGTLAVLEYKLQRKNAVQIQDVSSIEQSEAPVSPTRPGRLARAKTIKEEEFEQEERDRIAENVNSFTVGSIGSFIKSQADAYAGEFGRVRVSRGSFRE
ncbi:unnamed protein product, partial [Mesorhabditis belari]|uniref:Potassium channel domain-containing protein n=1 Tax=Mesorhabditis belari TaxID=2138241 RepID=A0AAF3EBX3_9BILA